MMVVLGESINLLIILSIILENFKYYNSGPMIRMKIEEFHKSMKYNRNKNNIVANIKRKDTI